MIIGATLLAGAVLFVSSPFAQVQPKSESNKVLAVVRGIIAADNRKDLQKVIDFYENDAVLLPPGEMEVMGVAAIRPRYERLFENFDLEINTVINEVTVSGSWAFVRGRNVGNLRDKSNGNERKLNDAYLMILHRSNRGVWRIARLMWSPLQLR
jgi:uncharacterized protein (TIGR02246 family)